jgi:hypothetical protein
VEEAEVKSPEPAYAVGDDVTVDWDGNLITGTVKEVDPPTFTDDGVQVGQEWIWLGVGPGWFPSKYVVHS